MAFFIIRMSHPNEQAWQQHIKEHMAYLHSLVEKGIVRALGKIVDASVKTGCILMSAKDRAEAEAVVANDPFSKAGVVEDLKIMEWDPFVGVFAKESSGEAPSF